MPPPQPPPQPPPPPRSAFDMRLLGRLLGSNAQQPPSAQPLPFTENIYTLPHSIRENLKRLKAMYFEKELAFGFSSAERARVLDHYYKNYQDYFFEPPWGMPSRKVWNTYLFHGNARLTKALAKLDETHFDYGRLQSLFDRIKELLVNKIGIKFNVLPPQTFTDQDKLACLDVITIVTDIIALHNRTITNFLDLFLDPDVDKSKYGLLFEEIQTELDAIDERIADNSFLTPPFAFPISVEQLTDDNAATPASQRPIAQVMSDAMALTHRLSSRELAPSQISVAQLIDDAPAISASQRSVTPLMGNDPAISQRLSGSASPSGKSGVGGFKRYSSKIPSYKYYLKAVKSYSKRKLKTFRKRRNYKKTKRNKY